MRRWRRRFENKGVAGVGVIDKGRGRRSWLPEGTVAEVVRVTQQEPARRLDALVDPHTGRAPRGRQGLRGPHLAGPRAEALAGETFKISNDPQFEEKLVDVVGLYMDPPERAVVFSFDEKTQVQALDRTQPSLPMKRGRAGTMTHDYKRNGTVDLFAALNIATGEVHHRVPQASHRCRRVGFLQEDRPHVPRGLDVHVVLDNLSAHMAPEVTDWLAEPGRARWHLHFTPTSSSLAQPRRALVSRCSPTGGCAAACSAASESSPRRSRLGRALERRPQALHLAQGRRGDHRQSRRGRATLHQIKSRRITRRVQLLRRREALPSAMTPNWAGVWEPWLHERAILTWWKRRSPIIFRRTSAGFCCTDRATVMMGSGHSGGELGQPTA